MEWLSGFLASLGAAVAGSLGLGGGGLLILYLTALAGMGQRQAQGINLVFFLPTALIGLFFHGKNGLVRWKTAWVCIPFGLLGIGAGAWLSRVLPSQLLGKGFAAFLGALALWDLWKLAKEVVDKAKGKGGKEA